MMLKNKIITGSVWRGLWLLAMLGLLPACQLGRPVALPGGPPFIPGTASPTQTAVPSLATPFSRPTATDIPSPTPTAPPAPTPTPIPSQTPSLYAGGVLTPAQKQRLAEVSLRFLAGTEPEAIKVAQRIGYLGINGYPSTMCGPLAMVILRDAGLVDPDILLKNFYYLNPRPGFGYSVVETVFPKDRYEWISADRPINQVDFSAFPLFAGDFMYIFAGKSGNFDHILTVTRIDEQGRAYAVTNLNTAKGFVIKEVMLYDPHQPGTGQLSAWMDRQNWQLGRTGSGGFWLWRLKKPLPDPDGRTLQLADAIRKVEQAAGGDWHVLIQPVGGDPIYARLPYDVLHPASTIKLADAVLFFNLLEQKHIASLPDFLDRQGVEGRTFSQLLHAMLVNSEEEATSTLEGWIRQQEDPNQALHDLGFTKTFVTPRQSNAAEMAALMEKLYTGELVTPQARQILLDLLSEFTPNDNTRIGVIRPDLGVGDVIYDKRGSLASERVIVADLALIQKGSQAYTVAIFAYPNPDSPPSTYEGLEKGVEEISRLFWNFIK
jgi:Beta-lactamase enzyme family